MRIKSSGRPIFFLLVATILVGCFANSSQIGGNKLQENPIYSITETGVVVFPLEATSKAVHLRVYGPNIIRVTSSQSVNTGTEDPFLMVSSRPVKTPFKVTTSNGELQLKTAQITAKVNLQTGKIAFYQADGSTLLQTENAGQFKPVSADPGPVDSDSYAIEQRFIRQPDEAFYGLGQHQNGLVNYADANVELTTHNLEIAIPLLVSSRHYGILWNNASITRFGNPNPPAPLAQEFILRDAAGNPGGLSVYYYDGDKLLTARTESDTNYQYLIQGNTREFPLPPEAQNAKDLRVELHGSITAKKPGKHTLKMYSSGYAKLYIDNQLKLDRWRMNWNPWYHDLDLQFSTNETKGIKIYWSPNGGYFHLLQYGPNPAYEKTFVALSSETAKFIDYFVIAGQQADDVIAGYRQLTGKAVMLPKWAYGFWQSRERYKSQEELLEVLKTYRERKIPIDNIVLDWSYWPENAWGSHRFDPQYFPNPKKMVDQVHEQHANIMISVWPKFYPTTKHYQELNKNGHIFTKNVSENNLDWIGPGYLNGFYDAFSEEARNIYWSQLNQTLNPLGFDAWWLDAVEPDMHSNLSITKRKELMTPNALGTGAEYFNAYALPHAEGVYKGDRSVSPEKRTFILTRSGFAGIQRTASAIWSGDIVSRWSNMKEQIAAGIGVGLSGMPNWTLDIGGFTPEDRYRLSNDGASVDLWYKVNKNDRKEWQELNTRWFQFGAFLPLFRSHGQTPYREIFNLAKYDSEVYNTLVWYTKLRYYLMPYIYSQAGDMYHKDGTLMRGLVMDFPEDSAVNDINDQYMFGPALLINPVYEYEARKRTVYLPKNHIWYDFYNGKKYTGGQSIAADAPLNRMPIFVKAGSIIPVGPEIQYVDEKPKEPITINIYFGADGTFELYEDDGKSYGYETGAWSRIPFAFENATKTFRIGARIGEYPGMQKNREFHLRWIKGKGDSATDFNQPSDAIINYDGSEIKIQL